jgi:magnesium chelatase subunit D
MNGDTGARPGLPFSAVVGLDDAKLALLLAACEPRLGGVLLRGQKGSAKTTLARGLAALLDAPFVELPLGATEDRVVGTIDAGELLTSGQTRVRPGLLAAADGGVLYVDEINLLADHLVDALLDAAVSGLNRIERDGVSHTHPARFVLVGSMNPEEGELRPQLLDRFGLNVDIRAPDEIEGRVDAVRRQLDLEQRPDSAKTFVDQDRELADRLTAWQRAAIPEDLMARASRVALEVGAEGLRADLMLCRAAAALAGWEGRDEATPDDLRRVAPLVLAHRRRRQPFDEPGIAEDELDDAFERASAPPDDAPAPTTDDEAARPPGDERPPPRLARPASDTVHSTGRRAPAPDERGRFVRAEPTDGEVGRLAVGPTAMALAARRASDPDATLERTDLRRAVTRGTTASLVVIAVDTSGSMGVERRITAAKGAVLGLLTDAYQQRDRVALIAFRGERADLVLRPTGSVEIARARLAELPTGGTTPLAAGIDGARDLVERMTRDRSLAPIVVLITDGRATAGRTDDPVAEARQAATDLAALGVASLVLDAEDGSPRLGLARELAELLGADYAALADLDPRDLTAQIRDLG